MGILLGLIAALCWGVADFSTTRVTRVIGPVQTLLYLQLVGVVFTAGLLFARPAMPHPSLSAWALTLVVGVCNLVGTLLLYRAFTIGTLALVSPIASGFAVVTALLALLAGERPALQAALGALLLIGGVVVVSRSQHGGAVTLAGVPEALGVTLFYGVGFWAVDFVIPALGVLWPVMLIKTLELSVTWLIVARRGVRPTRLSRSLWWTVIGASLVDTLAYIAFNIGLTTEFTSVVTALASLFSAVTVLLAWMFLRERLMPLQWAGVGTILLGVLLVSL